jgi:branched-chain amino acid transport system permease protein
MGGALELGLWRPLRARRTGSVAAMVVSIGLALVLRNLYQLTFESSPRPYREYGSQGPISIGPIDITAKDLWAMGICTVLLVIAALLLRFTRTGTSIRAVADEPALASASGIGVNRVILLVWIFGAGLTAAAGVLYGVTNTVEWDMGFRLLLIIFAAVVLGGLGSPAGAALGAILVGVTTEMSTYWIDTDLKFAVALVALIGVLLVRPQGLLGRAQRVA